MGVHDAAFEQGLILRGEAGDVADLGTDYVVRDEVAQEIEPKQRNLREDAAFARNATGEDAIEGRDAVGGDDEQAVLSDRINVADLAPFGRGPAF